MTNKRTACAVYGSIFNGLTGLGRIDGEMDLDLECSDADFQLYSKMEHPCNFKLYGALNRLMYSP